MTNEQLRKEIIEVAKKVGATDVMLFVVLYFVNSIKIFTM